MDGGGESEQEMVGDVFEQLQPAALIRRSVALGENLLFQRGEAVFAGLDLGPQAVIPRTITVFSRLGKLPSVLVHRVLGPFTYAVTPEIPTV